MRYVPPTLAALAVLAIPASAFAEEEVAWRLFVADHDQPRVTAIDLESGAALDSFAIDGPATLVWEQAANRLPVEQALLYALITGDWER